MKQWERAYSDWRDLPEHFEYSGIVPSHAFRAGYSAALEAIERSIQSIIHEVSVYEEDGSVTTFIPRQGTLRVVRSFQRETNDK